MNYQIYIDESGPFDEAFSNAKPSVVGGIFTRKTSKEWKDTHRSHLNSLKRKDGIDFVYPKHYHCGPMLSGEKEIPPRADTKAVNHFCESIFHNILGNAEFGFVSQNRKNGFEYSPQATYVMHLVAALRSVFDQLGQSNIYNIDRIDIMIAQRTIGETRRLQPVDKYMRDLLDFVGGQLELGEGLGVELARRLRLNRNITLTSGIGDIDPGLIAADFVCCQARNDMQTGADEVLYKWQADQEVLLGDYRNFYQRLTSKFLSNHYYGSCLEFICRYFPPTKSHPDVKILLSKLEKEEDSQVLERELPVIVAVVHQLSKGRSRTANALSHAIYIAEKIVNIAKLHVDKEERSVVRSLWLNMQIQMLSELAACYNHTGAVGPQQVVETKLKELLNRDKKEIPLDATQRQTLLHSIQNKNLNLLFNDYRFEDAYSMAEDLAFRRRKIIPDGEPDKLLGQILGSQGQACAYMAHQEKSWTSDGIKLLSESLNHFSKGSSQESMSRNFLATLLWQTDDLDSSLINLDLFQSGGAATRNPNKVISNFLSQPEVERDSFKVVNCLRLLAARYNLGLPDIVDSDILSNLEEIANRLGTDHPYEQWFKWLGILHWQQSQFIRSMECFSRAESLCSKQEFTMQTIGNSVTLLAYMLDRTRGKNERAYATEKRFRKNMESLRARSPEFDNYLRIALDPFLQATLPTVPDSRKHWHFFTYLPFSYA